MASLKDISRETGFSTRHIARVIKGEGHTDEKTAAIILDVAKRLNYFPNLAAKSLKYKRSYDILLFAWYMNDPLTERIRGLVSANYDSDYSIILELFDKNLAWDKVYEKYVKELEIRKPAGVILVPPPLYEQRLKEYVDFLYERNIPYIAMSASEKNVDAVYSDFETGVYEAVKYLISRGRKHIAYIGEDKPWDRGRIIGYKRALEEAGLSPIYIEIDCKGVRDFFDLGQEAAFDFLKMTPRPDAIQLFSDRTAFGFISGIHKHNIKIPEELSIVGIDNLSASSIFLPKLTTVAQQNFEIGCEAYKILVSKINMERAPESGWSKKIPTKLIVRESA